MTVEPAPPLARAPGLRAGGNLFAAASTLVWAAGFPAAEALLQTWDPIPAVAARFAMALAFLLPLWLILEGIPRGLDWRPGLVVGGLGFGGSAVTIIFAQSVTDPVTVAVIASASPLCATLVEWAFERRPLTRAFLLGLAASVVGGVTATMGAGGEGNLLLGAALALLSCLFYSWMAHETVRRMPGRSVIGQTTVTVAGAALATAALAVAYAALGGPAPPEGAGLGDLGLLAIYGIGAIAVSQLLFIASVRRIGVALASFHLNIAPFYVMLILIALGGGWSWMQALGAAIVIGGVLLAQR
jgi:drug/metabolite transporter (DMT)-like permease